MEIEYKVNHEVTPEQFVGLLKKTTLGTRRPVNDLVCIKGMLQNSNLIVSAWCDNTLVGIARSVTDFHYCCYLSDLAVDEKTQGCGIGKQLIKVSKSQLKLGCKLILLSAPQAAEYYPNIGFESHNSAWVLSDIDQLKM